MSVCRERIYPVDYIRLSVLDYLNQVISKLTLQTIFLLIHKCASIKHCHYWLYSHINSVVHSDL